MKLMLMSLIVLSLMAGTALSQIPDSYTNLQVLPKDIGKRELVDTMRSFAMGLGMRCTDCHEQKTPGDFSSIDWASDKLPNKEVARGMIKMTEEINANLLPAATGKHDFTVRCITCHRGVGNPQTLDQLLVTTVTRDGAAAGEDRYRELRDDYYGSGSYDFSPMTLATVAETLAQENADLAGARQMVLLNLEMNPDHTDSYLMLAQLDLAGGNKAEARANIEKVLADDPENSHAKRMLQQIDQ